MLETLIEDTLSERTAGEWDAFARDCACISYQQSPYWASVMSAAGQHSYLFATCRRAGTIIGTAVIRRSKLLGPYWFASSQRGPVIADPHDFQSVLTSIAAELREHGATTWQFAPRYHDRMVPRIAAVCRQVGAMPVSMSLQPIHVATACIDLARSENEILASFGQSARRKLRQAQKAGVTVREVRDASDVCCFQKALDQFASTHPDYSMDNQPAAAAQAELVAKLGGGMLLAELDGELLAAASYLRNGSEAIWLSLANTGARKNVPANYLLLWEKMRHARTHGSELFDLAGVPLDEHSASEGELNRLQFKNAFRPQRRVLLPLQLLPIRSLQHAILFPLRQRVRALAK